MTGLQWKAFGIYHYADMGVCGLGYDPDAAFSDWWAQTRRKWTEAGAVSSSAND